jgi:hypothetical protein
MGCCSSRRFGEVECLEAARVRWPTIATRQDLLGCIRYVFAKVQQGLGNQPGHMKREVVCSIVSLLIESVGSEDSKRLYESLGGRGFVSDLCDTIAHASRGKKLSAHLPGPAPDRSEGTGALPPTERQPTEKSVV